jgi:DNA modification methylase
MSMTALTQRTLFEDLPDSLGEVLRAYTASATGRLPNERLYEKVARRSGKPVSEFLRRRPVGTTGQEHSIEARRVRWSQQSLKQKGWLEPVPGQRGQWQLTQKARTALTPQEPKRVLIAFSTDLGVALWGSCEDVFSKLDEPITLCLTSPPYPLAKPRAYGNVALAAYVDWLCTQLEPIARNLVRGGTIALNVSNDIFEPGVPARSTYRERLVIAMCDRLGLHKMDELIWHNPTKAPGPVQWASIQRFQLNVAWEPVYVFTNDPRACLADNRRVLEEHTARHLRLIHKGGVDRYAERNDGAYTLRPGSYGSATAGRIPRNVLKFVQSGADADLRRARAAARAAGLPVHGAGMPLGLADFLVRYLCPQGGTVVEPFYGWGSTAFAADINGCPWIATEVMGEYLVGSAERFSSRPGFRRALT